MKIDIYKEHKIGRLEYNIKYSDGRPPSLIFYESDAVDFAKTRLCDGIIFAIAHLAMREADHVHLHGAVSKKSLLNLLEYQGAWVRWKPKKYYKFNITANEVVECKKGTGEALSAYSGGVDAMFSLFQNVFENSSDNVSHNLRGCLLVHGFDIPLSDDDAFKSVREKSAILHSYLNVDSLWIRTNSKEVVQDWEDSFAAQLMACLHLFSSRFDTALIGSSEPYDELVIPWGSSPITDHLLTGGAMEAVHYGAGYSRTEKIDYLSKIPLAVENLRVCWQGTNKTRNCGECEKCLRTRLNFEAAGLRNPSCFSQPFNPLIAKKIKARNVAQLRELESIVNFAKRHGNHAQWVKDLDSNVRKWRPHRRSILRSIARRAGLKYIKDLVVK